VIEKLHRRRLSRTPAPLTLLIPPVFIFAAMIIPLVYLLIRTLDADPGMLWDLVVRPRTAQLLVNTLLLTVYVLLISTVMGLPIAWITVRTTIPGRKVITLLAVAPLAVPGYVMAHSLLSLGGASGLMAAVGIPVPRPTGLHGAAWALSLYAYPYIFLNTRAALLSLDPGTEESARSLGYSPGAAFLHVILPLIAPGLVAGWVIVALYTLGDFGAVALMRFQVFSFAIYTQYTAAFDRTYAAALALILVLLTLVPLYLEARYLRHRHIARVGSGVARKIRRVPLGWWSVPVWIFLFLVIGASVGLPVVTLLYWMGLQSPLPQLGKLVAYFGNSIAAALPAALLSVLLVIPVAYLRTRYPSPISRIAERSVFVGYAIPPLALALAMVFFSLRVVPGLYQTLFLLILTYSLNFLALALGPIRSSLMMAPRKLEDAARSLGYGALAAFLRTILPILRRGIVASITLVFVMAMKELPMAFLLAPTGFTTLSVAVFSRTSEGMLAEAAPYAAAIVVLSSMFVGLLVRYEGQEFS